MASVPESYDGGDGRWAGARRRALDAQPAVRNVSLLNLSMRDLPLDTLTCNFRVTLTSARQTCEHRPDQRRSNRVGRRAGTRGRRRHHLSSRSCETGAYCHSRRPAAVFAPRIDRQLFPETPPGTPQSIVPFLRDALPGENGRRRGGHRYSRTRRRHAAAASPDQTGVHGDGIRRAGTVLGVEQLEQ